MEDQWITSVGIDIGTSTTKMIVSRLRLSRTSNALSLPRFEIVERELIYASPIYPTPLRSATEVDAERIGALLAFEYAQAGVRAAELKSGAVIITGETANTTNAQIIVHLLAEQAGDFVVATAGADLEALLAGKGAGADRLSLHTREAVANIDVGGGTANVAIFKRGKPLGTVTFHIGGRLIQLDRTGRITAISASLKPWLEANGYLLSIGQVVGFHQLESICTSMCRDMLDYISGRVAPGERAGLKALILGKPLPDVPQIETWTISGGIGLCLHEPDPADMAASARYGDMGPLLARCMREQAAAYPIRLLQPDQTVRATVIGAGMQSTEISGATIQVDAALLPIRNLPVLKMDVPLKTLAAPGDADAFEASVMQVMRTGKALFGQDAKETAPPFAFALSLSFTPTYALLQLMASALIAGYRTLFPEIGSLVVICESDIAKALGQSLSKHAAGRLRIICIDQISVEYGDYIDLGEPISGMMIPVVVKTLAFPGTAQGGMPR
ncbi:ethanolamine ammonia-lyase reactivating factor EutA [Paenibacillus aestuarii]|uniref:Ethanolamine ammonia-lyase reactivating factor EutA n=1 Tax=Paenibacillus aestuarii TaxID=516965 RepID=A0ABW0K6L2_9BACL|nr:ethanolamine ammonia-lyase reactivating factor EutA [Paenibacillus aestuarii]